MKLNPQQKEAVKYQGGPLLIIAGAGTGKTTVITERVKWLITKKGVSPGQILALTFTEKAAKEMEERIDQALPLGYSQLWISTFHSFCDRMLRDEITQIGLNPSFKLMAQSESILFLRNRLFDLKLNYFRPISNPDKFLQAMSDHFSRLQDEDINPEQYLHFAKKNAQQTKTKEEKLEVQKQKELAKAFLSYQKIKEEEGLFDFADLIGYSIKLFRQRPNVLREYQNKFPFILVDEFQDTNIAQYQLIKLLAPPKENPNLTVTGDDSQSIYKFRGAAVSNILTFMEDYRQSKMVVLTDNYRSTQEILDRSYQLIKQNNPDTLEVKLGISKNLKSIRKIQGKKIPFFLADRVENEAEMVASEIKNLTQQEKGGYHPKDVAILVRANNHSEPFVRSLLRHGIPYQFLGPSYLFRRPEIKDLIAYLELLVDPKDNIAFFRVASIPVFEISARTLALLRSLAKRSNFSLFESAEITIKESPEEEPGLDKLIKTFHRHLKLLNKETGGQILYYFLEDTGLLKSLLDPKTEADHQRAINIAKFFDKVKSFETDNENSSVFYLLDWITLRLEMGESPQAEEADWNKMDAVNILTVHSAKGLEFPVVFLVNLVNQRFPTNERREPIPIPQPLIKEFLPEGDPHEQEERRLFYVAMTRAMDLLYFTAAKFYSEAKREKKISPFAIEALGNEDLGGSLQESGLLKKDPQLSLLSWKKENEPEEKKITNLPVTYLSYSQMDSFSVCPLQYKYKYFVRLPSLPSPAQTVGQVLHRTLKEFYQKQITTEKRLSLETILEIFDGNWQSNGFRSKSQEKKTKLVAKEIISHYYQKEIAEKPFPKVAALEHPFSFKITPHLKVGGIIDRVDLVPNGEVEIIDYKTGERIPSQNDVDKDDQLTLYALAIASINDLEFSRPVEKIIISLYFLNQGVKLSSKRNKEQLNNFRKKMIKTAKEIGESSFPPNPGKPFPCDFCQYKLLCEAW